MDLIQQPQHGLWTVITNPLHGAAHCNAPSPASPCCCHVLQWALSRTFCRISAVYLLYKHLAYMRANSYICHQAHGQMANAVASWRHRGWCIDTVRSHIVRHHASCSQPSVPAQCTIVGLGCPSLLGSLSNSSQVEFGGICAPR